MDANGNPNYYYNNSSGYTDKIATAVGTVTFGYSSGNRTSVKDANGNTTNLTYDSSGNMTKITDPLSNSVQFSYDSNDNLTKLVDPAGNTSLCEYDANSNLTKITDSGEVTQQPLRTIHTVNYQPLLMQRIIPYTLLYDSSGNLSMATNPLGVYMRTHTIRLAGLSRIRMQRAIPRHIPMMNSIDLQRLIIPMGVQRYLPMIVVP